MATTIRINEDIKQQLKIKSAELGVTQMDLLNRYIIEGLKRDSTPKKPTPTIDELEKLLKHDNPQGNVLNKLRGIIDNDEIIDEVEEKEAPGEIRIAIHRQQLYHCFDEQKSKKPPAGKTNRRLN